MVELIGYLASALIVISLAMRSLVRLRVVSLVGSLTFVIYGALIGAIPVMIANGAAVLLNIWHLRRELAPAASTINAVPIEPDAPFLRDFLAANLPEIHRSQPRFDIEGHYPFARLLTRDGLPAGVFLARPLGDELQVTLDYVTPAYRDSRVARWLFGPGRDVFTARGVRRLVAEATTAEHRTYLESAGFRPDGSRFMLTLDGEPSR
ncbi:glycoside hydrolase family 15 protein [Nigerium massiliense]|uniref:hypothetical protein n=1 Tax=Nigerium massiliense TaxID=1522317 RepID=UPI0005917A4E|nr:hypothetical protein [Nigerium massiliense]